MYLDEAKTNGHTEPATQAWDTRFMAIERRLAEIAETGEQRVAVLRDAIADFAAAELAQRDEEIAILKKQITDFEQKFERQTAIDQRVNEISARLEEKQARRDSGKNADGDFMQTMGMLFAQERQSARTEFRAADEEMQRAFEAKLAAAEERVKAVPGKLPVAKIWCPETVTYQAEFVCHEGALWQACKDTAQMPGGSDWICVARAGRDGCDGRSPIIRGAYHAYEKYQQLDIVTYEGASYIARCDDPGLPYDGGWELFAKGSRGNTGDAGPRGRKGERGPRGEAAPAIICWTVDVAHYRATPTLADGSAGPALELRPLLQRFLDEALVNLVDAAVKDAMRNQP